MKLSGSQGAGSAWESGSASRAILLISWQSELFPTGPRLLGTPISGAGGYHQPVLIDHFSQGSGSPYQTPPSLEVPC